VRQLRIYLSYDATERGRSHFMITFLASPKPFTGLACTHQYQAIRSWLSLHAQVEVILYGDGEGSEIAARELGVCRIPDIETNEYGTPLFNNIVAHAAEYARHDLQVYLNCDILLTPEFFIALRQITHLQFLMVGSRLNLPTGYDINIFAPHWRNELLELARQQVLVLQYPVGSDYFAFRRGMWEGLPPVAIGRAGYDNALLAFCLSRDIPIIDATLSALALHREHEYGHVSGGIDQVWKGIEAQRNRAAVGAKYALPTLEDAQWLLYRNCLLPNDARGNPWRAWESRLRYQQRWFYPSLAVRALRRLLTKIGCIHPTAFTPLDVLNTCFEVDPSAETHPRRQRIPTVPISQIPNYKSF